MDGPVEGELGEVQLAEQRPQRFPAPHRVLGPARGVERRLARDRGRDTKFGVAARVPLA